MTDLTKLTAEEFRSQKILTLEMWDEAMRRLERLEKCEAALRDIKAVVPNWAAHSQMCNCRDESAKLIWQSKHQIALKAIQDAARAALEAQ